MAKAHIGTSGWQYGNWRGSLYPENLPQKGWLRYYSKYFDTVEVNSSFYRQTRASTFKKWQEQTPRNFVFSVKGHRYITHVKLLKDVEDSVDLFFKNAGVLAGRHVVLWQLPPRFRKDTERLNNFVKLLPKGFRHAFEFRHETWVSEDTWEILKAASVETTAVLQDWKEWPILKEPHGKFVYLRFHGRKALYSSNYSDKELEEAVKRIRGWTKNGMDVYAYFNNDAQGHAAPNAKALKELIEK